ncbi:InlB B-repeat-containing protein [Candidatus Methanoplasma termitum]|nr:hypothetical protein [Candidatus Methanoplasma termitum]
MPDPTAITPAFTLNQGGNVPYTTNGSGRDFIVAKGASFSITATQTEGAYTFVNWTKGGTEVGTNLTETITAGVAGPTTYVAQYKLDGYVFVTLVSNITGLSPAFTLTQGGSPVAGDFSTGEWRFSVDPTMKFEITAPTTAGTSPVYTLQGWSGEASGVATVEKGLIIGNTTYTALYYDASAKVIVTLVSSPTAANPAFTMTQASNSVPYTVNPAGGMDFAVTKNTNFTATAPMSSGIYTLQGWSGMPSGTATLTTQVAAAKTFTALYYDANAQVLVTLVSSPTAANPAFTLSQGGNVPYTVNPAGGMDFAVTKGVDFTATAPTTSGTSPVYTLQGWSGEPSGTATLTKQVSTATTFTALYYDASAKVIVTLVSSPSTINPLFTLSQSGNVPYTVNPAGGMDFAVTKNVDFTITAPPASGYVFQGWAGGASGVAAMTTQVAAAKTFTALYYNATTTVIVTLQANIAGISPELTLSQNSNPVLYTINTAGGRDFAVLKNTDFTATASPLSGYTLLGWAGELSGTTSITKQVATATTYTAIYYNSTYSLITLKANITAIDPDFTLSVAGTDLPSVKVAGGGRQFVVPMNSPYALLAPMVTGYALQGWEGGTSSVAIAAMPGTTQPTVTHVALYYNTATHALVTLKADPSSLSPAFTVTQDSASIPFTLNQVSGRDFAVEMNKDFTATAPTSATSSTSVVYTLLGWEGKIMGVADLVAQVSAPGTTLTAIYYDPLTQALVTINASPDTLNPVFIVNQNSKALLSVLPATGNGRVFAILKAADFAMTAPSVSGYTFKYWMDNTSTDNPRTITANTVTGATTYTAYYLSNSGTVTLTLNSYPGEGGTFEYRLAGTTAWISYTGTVSFNTGSVVEVQTTPAADYVFRFWNDSTTDNPKTVTMSANTTLTAYFLSTDPTKISEITLTASPTGAGTFTWSLPGMTVAQTYSAPFLVNKTDDLTVITAQATGYTFRFWEDASLSATRHVGPQATNVTFIAYFLGSDTVTVTLTTDPAGAGTFTWSLPGMTVNQTYSAPFKVNKVDDLTVITTAKTGYTFQYWEDASTSTTRHVGPQAANVTFTAYFLAPNAYTLTLNSYPVGAGSFQYSVDGGASWMNYTGPVKLNPNTVVQIQIPTDPDYTFRWWNDAKTDNPRTVTMSSNVTLTAYFLSTDPTKIAEITLVASPAGAGTFTWSLPGMTTVMPYSSPFLVNKTDSFTVNTTRTGEYSFMSWEDGSKNATRNIGPQSANKTFTAYFEINVKVYYITATADGNSNISPSGKVEVPGGIDKTFRFYANEGYTITSVIVDGRPIDQAQVSSGSYTFYSVNMNHTIDVISAVALNNSVTLTIDVVEKDRGVAEYSIDGSAFAKYTIPVTFSAGSDVNVRAVAEGGYHFDSWEPSSVARIPALSFDNASSSISLKLHFAPDSDTSRVGLDLSLLLWILIAIVLLIIIALLIWWFAVAAKRRKKEEEEEKQ